MAPITTNFDAQKNGFRFVNRFELQVPVTFSLPFGGSVDLRQVAYGLCGGMCFSALDYFNQHQAVPPYTEVNSIDHNLLTYLTDRQLDSLKIPVVLRVFQSMLSEDGDFALRMARYEIPKVRKLIDAGKPAVLALIRTQGISDPTHNHQVLATGYDFDPETKDLTIFLYDPNHPGELPNLRMNLAKPSTGIGVCQSTGEPLRGFFVIDYLPQANLPKIEIAKLPGISFGLTGMEAEFALRWPVDSHRINQYFGENPDTYKPFGLPGHEGLDLFALDGANVYAAADGEVYEADHPKDHPYGLQIRLKHGAGKTVYRTVYAHLSQTMVTVGQKVSAGDLIGLADNTGNSFGSHLHLTLKIDGAKTPGYPAGIVDPLPYLQAEQPAPTPTPTPAPIPAPSRQVVFTSAQVNLLAAPQLDSQAIGLLPAGEAVSAIGDAAQVKATIGKQGAWLQVITAGGLVGYLPAWLVQGSDQAFPPSDLVIYPIDTVNLRSGPATAFDLLATLSATDPLTVLGDAGIARGKLGQMGEWIQVQTENGTRGFVASWLVRSTGQAVPDSGLALIPIGIVNVRARPSLDSNPLTMVSPSDRLILIGDKDQARLDIGQMDHWLNVRTPEGYIGYVAAWLVQLPGSVPATPPPPPAELKVFATAPINIRAQPSVNSPRIDGAMPKEALAVIEDDLNAARANVGKQAIWIHIQKSNGTRGWVAAWNLSLTPV